MVDYWFADGPRAYHHTAPINMVYALHEGLGRHEEGLEPRWARHARAHEALRAALAILGFERLAPEGEQLSRCSAVACPTASTRPRHAARCCASTASRSAAASARSPGGRGASA